MDSLAKSDIFFVITTFAVVILTVVAIVAAVYIVNILKDLKYIARKAKDETDRLSDDLADLRQHFKKGLGILSLGGLIKKFVDRRRKSSKK